MKTYTAQVWRNPTTPFEGKTHEAWLAENRTVNIPGLSYAAALEIAVSSSLVNGDDARIMAEDGDYCEVYPAHGKPRFGTFAQTTLVHT